MPGTAAIKVPIVGVDKYTKNFNNMTKRIKTIGRVVSSVGKKMTIGLTAPTIGLGIASLKMSRDMNKAMANVGTLIPGQTERLKKFKGEVMDLAIETGVAATTIAGGLYETISAFGDAENPINKLTIATKMSKAGLSSVTEALSLVSAVTKGYGDTSDKATQKASDLAFMTVKLGQTTFPDLAASMGRVVPLAATLNVKQEELFGSFATLTGVTGNAAEVSTQLSAVMAAMMKPSAALTKTVKKLGYESASSMVKEIGLEGSMKRLSVATEGNSDKMAKLLVRKEALVAAMALTGGQAENFTTKIKAMGDASGATDAAFKAQTEGVDKQGFKWDQFIQRMKKLAVRIGDRLLPVIERIIIKLEPFIDKLLGASDESLELGLKIAGAAAAFGPLVSAVGGTISAFGTLRTLLGPTGVGAIVNWLGPLGKTSSALADVSASAAKATGALDGATGAAGRFGRAGSALGKVGSVMGKVGAVGAAAGVGVAIGEGLNQAIFDQQNQDYSDLMHSAESFTAANAQSTKDITEAMLKAEMTKKQLIEDFVTTENVMGSLASIFTDVESPGERVANAIKNLNAEKAKLQAKWKGARDLEMKGALTDGGTGDLKTENQLVKDINVNSTAEATIKVDFENVPEGVKPTVETKNKKGVKVSAKGAVMRGSL